MSHYIGVIFASGKEAEAGLHKLWQLDDEGDLTVHGAAVIRRGDYGYIEVSSKHSDAGMRTAIGIGVGALIGALWGPVGMAVGIAGASSIAVGATAGLGALVGGGGGLAADVIKGDSRETARENLGFEMTAGQSAVIAEVSEPSSVILDDAMARLGGAVTRVSSSAYVDHGYDYGYYGDYLYPYDYDPYYN